jgi:outer membrane protein TolC
MLNGAMGRPADAPIPELDGGPARETPIATAAAREAALEQRPELRAGTAQIERATAEVEAMRSMYRPMAMVRAGPASTMAEGSGAMLMFGVSVPIQRERLHAGVAEAQAMERMARADLEGMQRMVASEATAARESVLAARTRLDALENEVVPRARMAVDAALASYGAGQLTLVSVIDASSALWEARSEALMAETELGEAWSRFERALGGFEPGVEP